MGRYGVSSSNRAAIRALAVLLATSCSSSTPTAIYNTCLEGTETCACRSEERCDPGLTCRGSVCTRAAGTTISTTNGGSGGTADPAVTGTITVGTGGVAGRGGAGGSPATSGVGGAGPGGGVAAGGAGGFVMTGGAPGIGGRSGAGGAAGFGGGKTTAGGAGGVGGQGGRGGVFPPDGGMGKNQGGADAGYPLDAGLDAPVGDASIDAAMPDPFCTTSEPMFSFLDGFESYPVGTIAGASPTWQRLTSSTSAPSIGTTWAHACDQSLQIWGTYNTKEVDFAAFDLPSRPSKLSFQLWYAPAAYSSGETASFGLGRAKGGYASVVTLRATGTKLEVSTPWLGSVLVYDQLPTASSSSQPVASLIRVELDFCAGDASFYVGTDESAPLRTTVHLGGVGEFDGFFIQSGTSTTYIDDLSVWTPGTTVDPSRLCTLGVLKHFQSPGSTCKGLAWDGSALWMTDNLNKLFQIDPSSGAVLDTLTLEPFTWPGLLWHERELWAAHDRIGLDGTTLGVLPRWLGDNLAWDGTYIYSLDRNADKVHRYDRSGVELLNWQLDRYDSETMMSDGTNLWLLFDLLNPTIEVLTPRGDSVRNVSLRKLGLALNQTEGAYMTWDTQALWLCSRFEIYRIQVNPGTGPANGTCTPGSLPCGNGACVSAKSFCDHQSNCADGTDEKPCSRGEDACTQYNYMCSDRSCIWEGYVCDGKANCPNGEDEVGCPTSSFSCSPTEFSCTWCFSHAVVCDQHSDCPSGEDETNCIPAGTTCPAATHFACNDGSCIRRAWLCDHVRDCAAGEDENGCP